MKSISDFFKGLFINGVGGGSLGRVSYWILFGLAIWKIVTDREISDSHFYMTMALLTYQVAGKFSPFIGKKVAKKIQET